MRKGCTRVPPSTRVPPGSARAAGWSGVVVLRVPPGFHLRGGPRWFEVHNKSSARKQCVVRAPSEKPSEQQIDGSEDRFAHGRNTKQNRNQWFSARFHCFESCSLAQATRWL